MNREKIIEKINEIEEANADVSRLSIVLRLCAKGMQHLSESEVTTLPFKPDSLGDALEVLTNMLDSLHTDIENARWEIERFLKLEA